MARPDDEAEVSDVYDPSTLRPGDIILCVGKADLSLGGALDASIEWATDSPFDHAALVGDKELIEGLWRVTLSGLGKYADSTGVAYSVTATDAERAAAVAWMKSRVGQSYGVKELLEDAGRDILHLPLWPKGSPRAKQRYTCSGLVAAAYAQAGVTLTWAPWPSPADLSFSPLLVGKRPWETGAA